MKKGTGRRKKEEEKRGEKTTPVEYRLELLKAGQKVMGSNPISHVGFSSPDRFLLRDGTATGRMEGRAKQPSIIHFTDVRESCSNYFTNIPGVAVPGPG